MLYCKDNIKIFHVHVPRNAGRYVAELFSLNSYQVVFGNYKYRFFGIEIPHLHYPYYNCLEDVEDSPQFIIVRNPYERFKSHIKKVIKANHFDKKLVEKMQDKNFLFSFLEKEKYHTMYQSNVLRKQIEFLSPNIKIYKFEYGFGDKFINWISENFDICLRNENVLSYPKSIEENINCEINFDDSIRKTIEEYYSEDYNHFNY